MGSNTGTSVVSTQSFTTGVQTMAVGVLNPVNSPQTLWDTGVSYLFASMRTVVTGAPASCTILLEGSEDGSTWVTLATSTSTTGDVQFAAGTIPFTSLRARCTAFSGASTINVYVSAYANSAGVAAGAVTSAQGTRSTAANAWPTYITNSTGSNNASVNSNGGLGICGTSTTPFVGGTLFVQATDGTNVGNVNSAGGQSVAPFTPLAANILSGSATAANTVTTQVIITIPQGRTWYGTLNLSLSNSAAAGGAVAANINTVGTNPVPLAAVNLLTVQNTTLGAAVAGDVVNTASTGQPIYIQAPAGNSITVNLTNTSATTNTSFANANGILL